MQDFLHKRLFLELLAGLEPARSLNRGILRLNATKIAIFGKVGKSAKMEQIRIKNI